MSAVCAPPIVKLPPTRFDPIVIGVEAFDESHIGVRKRVMTSTVGPFNVMRVLAPVPILRLCDKSAVVSILTSLDWAVPPIVNVPLVRFDPIVMFDAGREESYTGDVNIVPIATDVPFKTVFDVALPIVIVGAFIVVVHIFTWPLL